MSLIKISILFLLIFVNKQLNAQNIKLFMMNIMDEWKFQCATTTCLPFIASLASDVHSFCQFKCLHQTQCKAVSFQKSTLMCFLFANTVDQNDTLEADSETITIIVISESRMPFGKYEKYQLSCTDHQSFLIDFV